MELGSFQKKFVTQDEIEEKRKKRQEEWDKVRTASDPVEAPEEVVDNRSLYERLQEQKQKKDDDYEEQFRLRNQVRGLDEEESHFLEFVSDRQEELLKNRENEDKQILNEYRSAIQNTTVTVAEKTLVSAASKDRPARSAGRKSQQAMLLGGAVKRKSNAKSDATDAKRLNTTDTESSAGAESAATSASSTSVPPSTTRVSPALREPEGQSAANPGPPAKIVGILPGLGEYGDSSDSKDSSDDSSSGDDEGLGLLVAKKKACHHAQHLIAQQGHSH